MPPLTWPRAVALCALSLALTALPSRPPVTAADVPDADVDLTLARGGDVTFTNSVGMKLVRVKAGKFMMGAPASEKDSYVAERPVHEVELTRDFYLGVTEVTQKQY